MLRPTFGALGPSPLYGASLRFEFLLAVAAIHVRVNDSRPLFSGLARSLSGAEIVEDSRGLIVGAGGDVQRLLVENAAAIHVRIAFDSAVN
jgi:hypothetical protein